MKAQDVTQWSWLPLAMALIAVAVLTRPAMPIDETRYLSVAWEMWQSGDYLVPHTNGLPYSHKPPLLFWLINFGWWLWDVQEWSARLTAPFCGLVALFLSRNLAGSLFPQFREVQKVTPFILLGMLCWAILASLTMFDTLMSCMALLGYLIAYRGATGTLKRWWLFMGLAIGGGVLAKGPIILVYVMPALLLAPWWTKTLAVSWKRWYGELLLAFVIGSIVALSWALPAAWAGGEEYGHTLLFGQTAGRMVKAFDHQRPMYYYPLILPLVFFPWSCWMPMWRGFWRADKKNEGTRFLVSILLPAFIILSLVSAKQVHYLLPLLPAAAILIALGAVQQVEGNRFDRIFFFSICGLITAAITVLPFLPIHGSSARFISQLPFWLGLCPLIAGLAFIKPGQKQFAVSTTRMTIAMALFFLMVHIGLSGPIHANYSFSGVSKAVADLDQQNQRVAVYPGKLDDQFHFAARLTKPVIPLYGQAISTIATTAPDAALLFNFKPAKLPELPEGVMAEPYKGGWLLLFQPGVTTENAVFLADLLKRKEDK
ncbi:ArnT family glycosyltransferase [Desulfopila aestuarii]|uniref:Dolichyl-phosphate-mannose-protein mannosyltransferase n=1 Tax=Desulfopila aestuarii DSM 18488 TaxID=1121416 RepID=A0A1M7XVF5_9BACT|nr:glycosyltransferase family 39 protein [Desulfopila aestuarii]SHO42550.1 Dolichyl-phosphate-mannose-protein mannosyltransferase [Desulfopila aestuarii DSM 18488]